MNNFEFPIHFAQLNVSLYHSFRFTLPEQDIGRNDIQISVDYGTPDNDNLVDYNAWAQLTSQSVRALVHVGSCHSDDPNMIVQRIMEDMNGSQEFYDTLYHFIEHFDRG